MTKNIIILFIILIAFTKCRKDPRIPFCELYPNECIEMHHIKDHYYFKTGSWWVYEEQNTGAIDSQWVSSSYASIDGCNFDLVINTSLDDYDRHRWTHLIGDGRNCGLVKKTKQGYIERSKTKPGDYVGGSIISMFYPVIGDSVFHNGGGGFTSDTYESRLRIENIYNSYIQNDSTYQDVVEISDRYNIVENSQATIHWYAEGVGLIRKELIDSNQVWLLTKYKVEQ